VFYLPTSGGVAEADSSGILVMGSMFHWYTSLTQPTGHITRKRRAKSGLKKNINIVKGAVLPVREVEGKFG